jgi:tetratricopeptide (TPR) repeat protein
VAAADPAKRLKELDRAIAERLDVGQIAEAIVPAAHRLDLLKRARGKDHWLITDARRDLETYQRLAAQPREVQERYAKARQTRARANGLHARGRYAEAVPLLQEILTVHREILGEDHPHTAYSYNILAETLHAQGKYPEAETMHRHALAIQLKALGEDHPHTARSYDNLGVCVDRQGRHVDALQIWSAAAASYEGARLRGAKGLESALTAEWSPLPRFALALASAGQPREAWTRWEQGLARGLVDEVTGRAARPLTAEEHRREADLLGQAQAIDERIGKLVNVRTPTQEQEALLDNLKRQASELRRQMLELEQQFERSYGALAGRPTALELAQKALPPGTTLVGWIDIEPDHWACLLRPSGDPVWVALNGSGKDGG